jgi:hypothetical protein
MTDRIADIIGDYRAFTSRQRDRLPARGIDIASYELSHLGKWRAPAYSRLRTGSASLAQGLQVRVPKETACRRSWLLRQSRMSRRG